MRSLLRALAAPCLSALAGLLVSAAATEAQTIQGIVVGDSHAIIHGARIRLQLGDRFVGQVFSDSAGQFTIFAGRAGDYRLEISQIGYETLVTDIVSLARGKVSDVIIRLGIRPVQLPALTIRSGLDIRERASYEGMLARHAAQSGKLLGSQVVLKPGDGEFDAAGTIGDVLQWTVRKKCWVQYFNGMPGKGGRELDTNTSHIAAIEVFRSVQEAPLELRSSAMLHPGNAIGCGVIMLWGHQSKRR